MPILVNEEPVEDVKAQLLRLKDFTRRTGVLQEAQVIQLKHWPYVLFPLEEHECHVDADDRALTYLLLKKGKKLAPTRKDRASAKRLEAWVWSLLGDEWKTFVNILVPASAAKGKKGKKMTVKLIHNGERKVPFEPPPPPGADFKRYGLTDKEAASDSAAEPLEPLFKEE
jgi:hypothetical protein